MSLLTEKIQTALDKINKKCKEIGRNPQELHLICASKYGDTNSLIEINNDGRITVFGENRVQSFIEKYHEDLTFDFIGQLQTNKVKYIIDKTRLIQSVDRVSLAQEIDRQAKKINKVQDILLEVNSGREVEKGGVYPEDLEKLYKDIKNYKNVRIKGIMVVAPLNIEENELRKCFNKSKELFDKLKAIDKEIEYLSMGMTNDFELAIECGSNMLRLGRVIFA